MKVSNILRYCINVISFIICTLGFFYFVMYYKNESFKTKYEDFDMQIIAITVAAICIFCFAGCGGSGMSHEEYEKVSQMEDALEQYETLDECHILTEDSAADAGSALAEQYGEESAEEIMDIIYDNTNKLGDYIN